MYNTSMPENSIRLWRILPAGGAERLVEIIPATPLLSIDQGMRLLPSGAYTTFRTFQHAKVLHLEDHLRRLEETARLDRQPIELDHLHIRRMLRLAVESYPVDRELRLRLLIDLETQPGTTYLLAEHLHLPGADDYRAGVKVITCNFERANPRAKLTRTMVGATQFRQALPGDVNEALMVDASGLIGEGLSSNFFAVKNDILWTAETGVLAGITRQLVLQAADRTGIPVCRDRLSVTELPNIQEAFITSSSRAVLPVRQVDEQIIGAGVPGPVTRRLAAEYERLIAQEIESI